MRLLLIAALLCMAGCSGTLLKGGASLVIDSPAKRQNLATMDLMLSRPFKSGELNIGVRHVSNVDTPDKYNGVNGLLIEMRQTIKEF